MARLGDVCEKGSSNVAQKDLVGCDGEYPIYGASGFISNVNFYHQEKPYIAVVKDGAGVGRIMKLPAKSSVIGTMQYILPNETIDIGYLAYAMEHMNLARYYTGATIPHIYFKDYQEEELRLPSLDEQNRITGILDKISNLISFRKQQLAKLDELVKVRFVEMFGDPLCEISGESYVPMTELCEIIDGDRGINYPKEDELLDEGDCLFLNAKNVTNAGFSFNSCMFITEKKDRLLRKGKLKRGDVVLTTRGTIGNLAFYDNDIPFEHMRINSGMVILRMNQDRMIATFFIEQFRMILPSIKKKVTSGSAQPQLPISAMNNIKMLVPKIEQQMKFSFFVEKLGMSRLTIQQSLDKLELLKKALMQEYFG